MSKPTCLLALCLGGTLLFGCKKEKTEPYSAPSAPSTPAAMPSTDAGSGVMSATDAKAKELMDQAMQYIKENKLDLAEKALDQVNAMEGLSPALRKQLDSVRGALQAAKAKGNLPEMPKIPS